MQANILLNGSVPGDINEEQSKGFSLQVLTSIATISSIKYRTVAIIMIHNGGTLASSQKAALAHDKAILQQMKLSHAQARLALEADNKLRALGL
jgi:hypothetical protein